MNYFKGIRLVTFDVTNTLLQFKKPPWEQYGNVARMYGYIGKDELFAKRFVEKYNTMSQKYPNFGKDTDVSWENWWREVVRHTLSSAVPGPQTLDGIAKQLIEEYKTAKLWRCADGSHQLLKFLRDKDMCIGIISNFDPRLHVILCNMNLHKYFDFTLTSYETGFSKPDSRIFEAAMKESNIYALTPGECLHIGDDVVNDYEGARAAEWQALLINDDPDLTKNTKLCTQHVFSNLMQLVTALQQGNK